MLHLFADTGTYTPLSLQYSFSGSTNNVDSTLLGKSDGSFILAVWLADSDAAPDSGTLTPVSPQSVTLTYGSSRTSTVRTYNSRWTLSSASAVTGTSLSLTVTDTPQFVTFK